MGQKALLEQSGQLWKLCVGVGVALIGWLVGRWFPEPGVPIPFFGSFVLGFGGLTWMTWSIRCPRCSARWFWLAATRGPATAYSGVALKKQCAICGYPAADTRLPPVHGFGSGAS
jgi:ribosomal protein L37E